MTPKGENKGERNRGCERPCARETVLEALLTLKMRASLSGVVCVPWGAGLQGLFFFVVLCCYFFS